MTERQAQESAAVWRSDELGTDPPWHVVLTDEQRASIVHAARTVTARGLTIGDLSASAFPLPELSDDIPRWTAE
ncbi:MAG TPA: hypothetical protein VF855_04030, partial [Acidimicrobiales bacterium]